MHRLPHTTTHYKTKHMNGQCKEWMLHAKSERQAQLRKAANARKSHVHDLPPTTLEEQPASACGFVQSHHPAPVWCIQSSRLNSYGNRMATC